MATKTKKSTGGTVKQRAAAKSKRNERDALVRRALFPQVSEAELWNREAHKGFTTIPKTLPLIAQVLNELQKGKPLFSTYFALWCNCWDSPVVEVQNARNMAYESGFDGQRAESTWRERIQLLVKFGFIAVSPGPNGDIQHILLKNPHLVVPSLFSSGAIGNRALLSALLTRAHDVGANDLIGALVDVQPEAAPTTTTATQDLTQIQ